MCGDGLESDPERGWLRETRPHEGHFWHTILSTILCKESTDVYSNKYRLAVHYCNQVKIVPTVSKYLSNYRLVFATTPVRGQLCGPWAGVNGVWYDPCIPM